MLYRILLSAVLALGLYAQSRIVGGQVFNASSFKNFDFVVGVGALQTFEGKSFVIPSCSGTLLSDSWVLTAGHCLVLEDMYVYGGTYKLFDKNYASNSPLGTISKVAQVFYSKDFKLHELFDQIISVRNDVALLQLQTPIKASVYPKIPTLDQVDDWIGSPPYAKAFTLAGWGVKENNTQTLSARLVSVEAYGNAKCKKLYQSIKRTVDTNLNLDLANEFDPKAICAGGIDTQLNFRGACFGDSGGGLYYRTPEEIWVLGVVSSGASNVCGYYPAMLMNLGHYKDYIASTIKAPLKSVVRRDILRKGYIDALPKGVHMLGSEHIIDEHSDLLESVQFVLVHDGQRFKRLEITNGHLPKGVSIKPKSGFWIKK